MLTWVELSVPFLSSGVEKRQACFRSCHHLDPRKTFYKLCLWWGTADLDLIAFRLDHEPDRFMSMSRSPQAFSVDTLFILWNHFNLLIPLQAPTLSASEDREERQSGDSYGMKLAKESVVLGNGHTHSRCCLGSTGLSRPSLSRSHVLSCFIVACFDCLAVKAQVLRDWSFRFHDFHFAGGQKARFS